MAGGGGSGGLADLHPSGPTPVLLLACPGRRLLGTFRLCEARRDLVSRGQSHRALRWMPGPANRTAASLPCYLWRPPDSGLMSGLWVGPGASPGRSADRPTRRWLTRVNQLVLRSLAGSPSLVLEASGHELVRIVLGCSLYFWAACVCVSLYESWEVRLLLRILKFFKKNCD